MSSVKLTILLQDNVQDATQLSSLTMVNAQNDFLKYSIYYSIHIFTTNLIAPLKANKVSFSKERYFNKLLPNKNYFILLNSLTNKKKILFILSSSSIYKIYQQI